MSGFSLPSIIGIQNLANTTKLGSTITEPPSDILFHERDHMESRPLLSCSRVSESFPTNFPLTNTGFVNPMPGLKLRSVIGMEF